MDTAAIETLIRSEEDSVYRVKGYILTADGPLYFDYSKAGFAHAPATARSERERSKISQTMPV